MSQLYPPYIEGKLPAQAGNSLTFNYELNRATGWDQVQNATLNAYIKNINTNKEVEKLQAQQGAFSETSVTFGFTEGRLDEGQHYKIQLGWDNSPYLSTVGVFKYTARPSIKDINPSKLIYEMEYDTTDTSEPLFSYSYKIGYNLTSGLKLYHKEVFVKQGDNKIIINIGEAPIHPNDTTCIIELTCTSLNGLKTVKSISNWNIKLNRATTSSIITNQVEEPGCNVISISKAAAMLRKRLRTDIDSPWEIIATDIKANSQYIDKNIEHGSCYLYQIIYQDGTYDVWAPKGVEFEHMYLSDAHNIYCLQFNPKVSSFKNAVVESKQTTIGGKYPVFMRNGHVSYKEFSLSALISFLMNPKNESGVQLITSDWLTLMDENQETLLTQHNLAVDSARITDLTSHNIYHERLFREDLLAWLTDGQPKFFRSPTEGNYIIRLTNVSMTPNDTLGRMIYTMNCTATEIAEVNQKNLIKYKLI